VDAEHIKLLRVMDEVHTIVSAHDDIESMLDELLGHMLAILGCDRAWLLYPCDPQSPSWRVPMERTVDAWPGAHTLNLEVPMNRQVQPVFEAALATDDPVTFDRASALQLPAEVTEMFGVRAQMILGVHPKTDKPWMLGIHHCTDDHVYTQEERTLFAGIGRRLGDALSTLVALRDLRASEANLERAVRERTAQLERANEELRAFSYSVSHDLRAPTRQIRGFGELLLDGYADVLDETGKTYLNFMISGSARMDEITSSLLRLARATRAELEFEPVNLTTVATEIAANLRESSQEQKVTFSIEPGLEVTGDSALLRIAFENLLENAWKYSSHEAESVIHIGLSQSPEPAVYVRDNGVGFDMEQSHKLFESFSRLHSGFDFAGTGIGLATVRRIVSRHGGRVWAEGEPGHGATFYVALPSRPASR
jgi:signal transduction histidine kinase